MLKREPKLASPEGLTRKGSGAPLHSPTMHILALSTPQTCWMLACWTTWIRRMMLRDPSTAYELHVRTYTPTGVAEHSKERYKSEAWYDSVFTKVGFVSHFMRHAAENATVLFTDLDVVPLGPYSLLVALLPPTREMTWMYTGQKIAHMPVNSGFYLMRNTPNVRAFLGEWHRQIQARTLPKDSDDQRYANVLLTRGLVAGNISLLWNVFPSSAVTAWVHDGPKPVHITSSTLAFHAVGRATVANKLARIDEAFNALRNASGRAGTRCMWQRSCTAAEAASCV